MPEATLKKVLEIEYPRRNETITSDGYAFRVFAMPGVGKIEISISGSTWEPCRRSGDSFWYDWYCYSSGEYEAVARIQLADGHFHVTEPRRFTVELKNSRHRRESERRPPAPGGEQEYLSRPGVHRHMATQLLVVVPNRQDVLSQLTQLLSREGVNIDSLLMETFGDISSVRFLLEKDDSPRAALKSEGFHVVEDKVFVLDLRNRPGELDRLIRKLAEEGVSVRSLFGTSLGRTTKVVFNVDRPDDAFVVVKEFDQRLISVEA